MQTSPEFKTKKAEHRHSIKFHLNHTRDRLRQGERHCCRPAPRDPTHDAPQLVPYNCAFLRLFYVFGLIERSFCMMCLVHCAVDASFLMVICMS